MTDTAADRARARWASAFADELAGFAPGPYPDVPDEELPVAPVTRLKIARDKAAARAQRARDRARISRELDKAIAEGLRGAFQVRRVYDRLRDGEDFAGVAVRIELVFGQAMTVLVEDYGWERTTASRALNARLLRPARPPQA